ncbi:RNA-binding domain-containing protein [Sulfurisphaera ohwakuensis]|uniref:RNA-binding domain-containing protein n=1 Tax=Sulfurisphaera ohwakuensis TaxID=69656 RepID=UPI0036F33325
MKLSNLSIIIFCHETENKDKILVALGDFFGSILKFSELIETKAEGHYGNSIEIIEYKLSGKNATEVANKIFNSFDYADLILLLSTLDERMEGSKLHLRIDKQRFIAEKKISLKDGDDIIKIIMSFKGKVTEQLKEELKQIANRNLHT